MGLQEHDPRSIAREEAEQAEHRIYDGLYVGTPGSDQRAEWLALQRWMAQQKKRRETQKERAVSSLAGIGYGILGTFIAGAVSWVTGILQWVSSILISHR